MFIIRHFGIVVQDLDRVLGYYRDFLGFVETRRMEESGEFLETVLGISGIRVTTVKMKGSEGEVLLELLKFHHPQSEGDVIPKRSLTQLGPTHFALTVANVEALYQKLRVAGHRFISEPRISADGGAKVCFGFDPEGNPIEFVEVLGKAVGK